MIRNYEKLFHLLIGNCFRTSHLLIENNFGRSPKFIFRGYFFSNLGTIDVLIVLSLMVPFDSIVPFVQSKPTFRPKSPPPDRGYRQKATQN